jgi:aspartate carbamoyltransferase catalytic subunit
MALKIAEDPAGYSDRLSEKVLMNLFMEPSTRTRTSFELAAKRLGMHVINFHPDSSSTVKGEALSDTFDTLQAMQPDVIVVRHQEDGIVAKLAAKAEKGIHVINAGDGCAQHPTQALLDAVTLLRVRDDLTGMKVTYVGDIKHSRVARSGITLLQKLGVAEIRLAGPAELLPDIEDGVVKIYQDMDKAIRGSDVVIMLRIQRERFGLTEHLDEAGYFDTWGLTPERISLAAKDCLVMHPGPVNRGVEIASEVADGPQSMIRAQVLNGVYTRMAVLLNLTK